MLYEIAISFGSILFSFFLYFSFFNFYRTNDDGDDDVIFDPREDLEGKELLLVTVVFRHGPRTPADTYPLDPHINQTFYPFGWGHITNDGKKYCYDMGQWLRTRYGTYLGNVYMPDHVWAQTTGVTRTKMTMATVLAGLFPPRGTANEWNRLLNWQPIPIFSEPLDEDTFLLVRTPCARYHESVEEVLASPEVKAVVADHAELMTALSKHTGLEIKTPEDVQSVYGTLKAEQEYGLKLPDWTKPYFPKAMENLTELSYIYNIYTEEQQKIKCGPFFKKLAEEFEAKRSNTLKPKDLKISLYTGHDSTVVNFLYALGIWEQQQPTYGIMAGFELLKDKKTGEIGVEIFLRNSATSGAIPLTLPGCDHFCSLDKFLEIISKFTGDRKDLCTPKNKDYTTPAPTGP